MASVDVIVPCYNYARYLQGCIDSVLTQEGVEARVLIIDDASTDATPKVGGELARRDPRVEYRRHATNKRHIATYNEGLLEWASADYSLLLSADDLLAPGALLRAARVMDAHADVHMTYGMALLFYQDAEIADRPVRSRITDAVLPEFRIVPGMNFMHRSIVGNPVPTPAAMVRTSMQRRLGGYSAALPHTADMEMWMRFAAYGSIGVVPYVQAYKRMHAANMSIGYQDAAFGDIRERLHAYREVLTRHAPQITDRALSLDVLDRKMAEEVFWSASRSFERGERVACQQALDFALALWPSIRTTGMWQKLRLKRLLPAAVWRPLRYAIGAGFSLRRGTIPQASPDALVYPRHQIGWWPNADMNIEASV